MVLPASARRQELDRMITQRGFVRVIDASVELGVSEVTVRADLSTLERRGRVTRVHGGAMPAGAAEPSLETALDRDAAAKVAIGRAAALLVGNGDSIYVDAGSTSMAFAQALVDRHDLHDVVIVTSGLTIALALEPAIPRLTVLVTGGTLRPLQHSLVNPFAASMLDTLTLDVAFIGCNGVHPVVGATNINLAEAEVKSRVRARSRRGILLADATKLGHTALAAIGAPGDFDTLVTAGIVNGTVVDELREAGMTVLVADKLTA